MQTDRKTELFKFAVSKYFCYAQNIAFKTSTLHQLICQQIQDFTQENFIF